MPFKSEKQRRYLWANEPEVARRWENKYNEGGDVMPHPNGLMSKRDEDITITRKLKNGTTITVKSPEDSTMAMDGILGGMVEGYTSTPVSDNTMINVTPGEYVVNVPAAQKYKGLLEMINQEGRHMLEQGGWVDKAMPMGYQQGGWPDHSTLAGYQQGGSPLGFAGAADLRSQDFTNQPPQQVRTPVAIQPVQQQVQQPVVEPVVDEAPVQPTVQELDQEIDSITPDQVSSALAGNTDTMLQSSASQLLGDSTGIADLLGNLESSIEKQESKRDSVKLMAFGLSLLGGEGIQGAVSVANSVGRFNENRINELYNQRHNIQNAVTNKALGDAGYGPAETVRSGSSGSSGTTDEYPDLTATLQKEVRDLTGSAKDKRLTAGRIDGLVDDIELSDGLEGVGGTAAELFKGIVGAQGDVSLWKRNFTALVNSEVVNNLPPGVASDRDIALIKEGFPENNWDKDTIVRWLKAYKKVTNFVASRDQYHAEHIEKTGRQTGWESGFNESYGTPTEATKEDSGEFDYDFSL